MAEQFDPYRKWLGIPSQDQPPNHYQLLGIPALENDPDVIENAANRQMAHVRTFQTGKHSKVSQQILNELSAAKRCLLVPEKKADYDAQFQKELAAASRGSEESPRTALPPSPQVQQAPPPLSQPTSQATSDPVQIRSRRSSAARRHRRKQRKSSAIPMLVGIIVTAVVIGLIILAANRKSANKPGSIKPSQEQTSRLVYRGKTMDLSMVSPV